MFKTENSRIPLYIDAAKWARSNADIFEYIVGHPTAKRHGVSASEIIRIADSGKLTLAINGWNEILGSRKLACLEHLRQLATSIPELNFMLTTRSASDSPNIGFEERVHVRGLSWKTQSEIIHNTLDKNASGKLIDLLAQNTRLRHAARSPLILKGLISQSQNGDIETSSIFDLLGAVVSDFEEGEQRHPQLQEQPIRSQQCRFLESLAFHQSSGQETNSIRQEILPVISATARQLTEDGYYGTQPDPNEVLDALCTHHLLHSDGSSIRFAHQRFQEYFTARILLQALEDDTEDNISALVEAVNYPFFEDALSLICGKLKRTDGYRRARILLVKTALGIDLGFACELAGCCSFDETDDADLFHEMVSHINSLCDSCLPKVAEYGLGCLIASRFSALSPRLWPLLEDDDQQTRLNTYKLLEGGITLEQLGTGAEGRIANWPPKRRSEFLHALSDNTENYSFLVQQANEALDNTVRAAAISALSWNFPASEATLQAWLHSPVEVQLTHDALSAVDYAVEQGDGSDELYEALRTLFRGHAEKDTKCRLALAFPQIVGPDAIEVVLAKLGEAQQGDHSSLISLVETHAPEQLRRLAAELILSGRTVPDWTCEIVYQLSTDVQSEIFESAWSILHGESPSNLSVRAVGPLASRDQVLRCVNEWLSHCRNRQQDLSESERETVVELRHLLGTIPGDKLLSVIVELGPEASYVDAAELLDRLSICILNTSDNVKDQNPWMPTKQNVTELISIFRDKSDDEAIPQNKLLDHLCSIASQVDPVEFNGLVLDGFHKYQEASVKYQEALREWIKDRRRPRPNSPMGGDLIASVQRGGFDALPSLLDLLDQRIAYDLVPSAISRIVSAPWLTRRKTHLWNVATDLMDGEERRRTGRALLQPNDELQNLTDHTAGKLCTELTGLVDQLLREQKEAGADWNEKQAVHRMQAILSAVSRVPSPVIVKPLMHALVNGFVDPYEMVDALKSLIRNGAFIEDAAVIRRLEKIYADKAQAEWLDDHARQLMWEICQIMWAAKPSSLLGKSLIEYMQECQRYTHRNEIIRALASFPHDDTWDCIIEFGKQLSAEGNVPDDFLYSLIKTFKLKHFEKLIDLIQDGTWFTWFQIFWHLKQVAPTLLQIIGEDQMRLDTFLTACEDSDSPYSDGFACAVLNLLPKDDTKRMEYGLRALDAGRAIELRSSVYSMLKGMFTLHVPLNDSGSYEVHPKSCNDLRFEIFTRSKELGEIGAISRQLLAHIESQRREGGRPTDEPRHPALDNTTAWTAVLEIVD